MPLESVNQQNHPTQMLEDVIIIFRWTIFGLHRLFPHDFVCLIEYEVMFTTRNILDIPFLC